MMALLASKTFLNASPKIFFKKRKLFAVGSFVGETIALPTELFEVP